MTGAFVGEAGVAITVVLPGVCAICEALVGLTGLMTGTTVAVAAVESISGPRDAEVQATTVMKAKHPPRSRMIRVLRCMLSRSRAFK